MGYNGCLVEEGSPDTFGLFNYTYSSYKRKYQIVILLLHLQPLATTIILKYTAFLLQKILYILRLYQMYIVIL